MTAWNGFDDYIAVCKRNRLLAELCIQLATAFEIVIQDLPPEQRQSENIERATDLCRKIIAAAGERR